MVYIVLVCLCFFELLNEGLKLPKEFLHGILQKWGRDKWTGVSCADNGDIIRLHLGGQGLAGDVRCHAICVEY